MTGLNAEDVVLAVQEVISGGLGAVELPAGYEVANTSARVVRFIISTASRHHDWAGIRR